jgi:hypothetical protein
MELWFPWVKITLIALVGLGLFAASLRLSPTKGPKYSAVKFITGALCLSLFSFAVYLAFMEMGPRNSELVESPDGKHVARIMITAGSVVDSKYSSVIVRKTRSPTWRRAYFGFGYFQEGGPVEPNLHWVDNSHLIIDYQQSKIEPSVCVNKVEDILIECRAHNW